MEDNLKPKDIEPESSPVKVAMVLMGVVITWIAATEAEDKAAWVERTYVDSD